MGIKKDGPHQKKGFPSEKPIGCGAKPRAEEAY